jgi:hypothetical protein
MIPNRESPATSSNRRLRRSKPGKRQSNREWLAADELQDGIILLGGSSLADFRLRVAQSGLRSDLTPSYWSLAGLLLGDGKRFLSAPLGTDDVSKVPQTNAVQICRLADYDDADAWPNIAVVRFASEMAPIVEQARDAASRRTVVELPELILAWLGYVWGVSGAANPLIASKGIPSAVFVETAHALAGVELTPGLASAASCPEAIWQAAKWWHEYYQEAAQLDDGRSTGPVRPYGRHAVRQPSAQLSDGK